MGNLGHVPLELRSDFPNGNGINFVENTPDHWSMELVGELNYAPWCHVEVKETVGRARNLKLDILNLPSNPDVLTECDRPVIKINDGLWQRIPEEQVSIQKTGREAVFKKPTVRFWEEGRTLIEDDTENRLLSIVSINVEIPPFSIARIAFTYPYTYERFLKFIKELSTLKPAMGRYIHLEPVGLSEEGRALQTVTIREPVEDNKNSLFMTFRMHPGLEASSSWACEFIIRSFLKSAPKSMAILKRWKVIVVPMVNVDGVYHGNERFNAKGVDLFLDFKKRRSKETSSIYPVMIEARPDFYIDWHGWLCHDKGERPFDGAYFDLDGVSDSHRAIYQDMMNYIKGKVPAFGSHSVIDRLGPQTAPSALYRDLGVLGCVLEINPAFSTLNQIGERSLSYFYAICDFLMSGNRD